MGQGYHDKEYKQKRFEVYRNSDRKLHREDGPAYIEWYENGSIAEEEYWINDKLHREDGPAFQSWFEDGRELRKEYYINDVHYLYIESWLNKLKEIGSVHYDEQQMLYDTEKYKI